MVTIRPKTVIDLKLHGACTSDTRTDISVRNLEFPIDERLERGGTNAGPSPTETLMAALAGCTNRITHKCADAHGVEIAAMSVDVDGKFDRRGSSLEEEIDVPFPEVTLKIAITTDADDAAIEKVKTDLAKFCPISKVIRQSGTKIKEIWTVTRP